MRESYPDDMFPRMNTAFLGLGAIGRPMAARIAAGGLPLAVWNRTAERAQTFANESGARIARSPADAVRDADVIITCFSTSPDVYSVLDGPDGVLAGIKKGSALVDCTSGDPATSKKSPRASPSTVSTFSMRPSAVEQRAQRRERSPSWSVATLPCSSAPDR